jgi:hypothetical protein
MSVNRFTLLYNPEESVEQGKEQGLVNTRQQKGKACQKKKKKNTKSLVSEVVMQEAV